MIHRPPNSNNFDIKALSAPSVVSNLQSTRSEIGTTMKHPYQIDFANVLYLNSSDPIEVLHDQTEDLEGKSVLTVAGSGEFAQVFLDKGASQINIFDVSAPGLFFNELKLEALRRLTAGQYRALFNTSPEIFDRNIYKKIADSLSPQAKAYFDTLCLPPNSLLLSKGVISLERPTRDKRFWSFMRDRISDEASYEALQKKANQAIVTFNLEDIREQSKMEKGEDLVYLSNVPEIMFDYSLVADFIKRGSKRVLFTQDEPIKKNGKPEIVGDNGPVVLSPGDTFKLHGMTARLFGYDPNILFGAIIEVRAEDNPGLRPS